MLTHTTLNKKITVLIPENLDIDAIIQRDISGFHGKGLKKEMLLFLCSELLKSRAFHRKEMLEERSPYAPLCAGYLKDVVYNYDDYLDFLIKHEILLTDNHFIVGEKCKGYCFNAPYDGQKLKRIEVENYTLKKNLRIRALQREKERKKQMWGYSYLGKWWETGKLKIDQEAAFNWIEEYREQKLKELAQKKRVKKRAFKIKTVHETAEDFKELVLYINSGKKHHGFSGRAHRFYNPITTLKRELRVFLTYDGLWLSDVDVSNSQPFLSLMLFELSFWKSIKDVRPGQICLEGLDKERYRELRNCGILNQIITLLKSLQSIGNEYNGYKNYRNLVINGGLYEYIQKHFEPLYANRFNERQKVKKEVLRILYLNPRENGDAFHRPCQTFSRHFREVYGLFELIKSLEHSYLPVMLQRLESFLVLEVVCKEISRLYPHIPLFTIHDNIITTKGNEGVVKEIMLQQIQKWTGHLPKVESKDLIPLKLNSIK